MSQLPQTAADLLAVALAMDLRSADRYAELADSFEISCNLEAAQAFGQMADLCRQWAGDLAGLAPAPHLGVGPDRGNSPPSLPWDNEGPDIADPGAVHYLMHPWHVFDLALCHAQRAQALFAQVSVPTGTDAPQAVAQLCQHQTHQVAHILALRDACPLPPDDWADDEDPPNWDM